MMNPENRIFVKVKWKDIGVGNRLFVFKKGDMLIYRVEYFTKTILHNHSYAKLHSCNSLDGYPDIKIMEYKFDSMETWYQLQLPKKKVR